MGIIGNIQVPKLTIDYEHQNFISYRARPAHGSGMH